MFSYNRLGRDADEADAEEIINMASKASLADQQKQVQENIHYQIENFCISMNQILFPDKSKENQAVQSSKQSNSTLSFASGKSGSPADSPGEFFCIIFSLWDVVLFGLLVLYSSPRTKP